MADDAKRERLRHLSGLPPLAQMDHRLHGGARPGLDELNRHERRKLKKNTKALLRGYYDAWERLKREGAGYPVDQLLRQFASEYNNRYLSSGTHTQPVSFRYFEAFLDIHLFKGAAPFCAIRSERDHLFDLQDFLDYATASDIPKERLCEALGHVEEAVVYHYSCIGDPLDFTILAPSGRQFAVSGFSLIRHGSHIHWFVLGGELLSDDEWEVLRNRIVDQEIDAVLPAKKAFVAQLQKEKKGKPNPPVPLEGTDRTHRTILTGEFSLVSEKHLARSYMSESEHAFDVASDDPETIIIDGSPERLAELRAAQVLKIEHGGVLWNLAECFLRLPAYFKFKFSSVRTATAGGSTHLSGGHVRRSDNSDSYSKIKIVSALEIVHVKRDTLRRYTPPRYAVEIDGHWRRLRGDAMGVGPDGDAVVGKTWIKAHNRWRERPARPREILLKSSVAAARLRAQGPVEVAAPDDNTPSTADAESSCAVLYVLRCPLMDGEIYKIGWTSKTASDRAEELSSQTGVPMAYVVVESWQHRQARELERVVHAQLSRHRVNARREFFKAPFETIRRIIVQEIERLSA